MSDTPDRPAALPERRHDLSASFLETLGQRVRATRARAGMTRKDLAKHSGVSERHLAQLETGKGNISVGLLRNVALAIGAPVGELLREGPDPTAEQRLLHGIIDRLHPPEAAEARHILEQRFANREGRMGRLALIGLRGAGKSSVGKAVADATGSHFLELAQQVEKGAGMALEEIFEFSGQAGYRRHEQSTLRDLVARPGPLVIATGGGVVSENQSFQILLSGCFTIWLKATPELHMKRVVEQGDDRPMAGNRQAMQDLRNILNSREALYEQADAVIDTSAMDIATVADRASSLWNAQRKARA